ncbi:MAG: SDR family NAD(P)-dependent oxidoreductase [Anaerolineales bacterium]|jgi:2-deoxy-D-gluconate 3-dehydrogenase
MPHELFSLDGKVALVTGGNSGIGRGLALGLRAAGARVAVTGRNPAKNAAVAQELGDDGAVFPLDVADEAAVRATIAAAVARFDRLDILVNNAGTALEGTVLDKTLADWEGVIRTNLTGPFLCAREAARVMIAAGRGGKIINIGSIYSHFGTPDFADYGASKAGLLGLTRALAIELAPYDIQVNAILPGWYATEMTETEANSARGEEIRRKTPAGRWGRIEDLVGACIFLASAASDFVTGIDLPVDGGYLVSESFQPGTGA